MRAALALLAFFALVGARGTVQPVHPPDRRGRDPVRRERRRDRVGIGRRDDDEHAETETVATRRSRAT